jgi:hypothetical protein
MYDLEGVLQALTRTAWRMPPYADDIAVGDRELVWLSGPDGGLRAEATMDNPVAEDEKHDAPFIRDGDALGVRMKRVGLGFDDVPGWSVGIRQPREWLRGAAGAGDTRRARPRPAIHQRDRSGGPEGADAHRRAFVLGIMEVLRGCSGLELFEKVVATGASLDTARAHALAMQGSLLLALGSDSATTASVTDALEALRAARRAQADLSDPEDGPATPLLLAARRFADRGEPTRASALVREALTEVGERFWAHRADAEARVR